MKHAPNKSKGKPVRRPKLAKNRVAVRKRTSLTLRVPGLSRKPWDLTDEQVTLLKNTIAKGASDNELQLFLTQAIRRRLDPFSHQIWLVRRWDKNADSGRRDDKGNAILGAHVAVPQMGIDGFRHIAARDHRDFGSVSKPAYGPMMEVTYDRNKLTVPEWASVSVRKKGMDTLTEAEAYWEEYAPADLGKAPFWRKMPRHMLGKCAEALALRKAYPEQLSGIYIPEETERIAEDYTSSGRQILSAGEPDRTGPSQAQVDAHDAVNPKLAEFEKREKEQLDKLANANSAPPGDAQESRQEPCIFYTFYPKSETYRIDGNRELMAKHREVFKVVLGETLGWSPVAKAVVATTKQLGTLISRFEDLKVPFRDTSAT